MSSSSSMIHRRLYRALLRTVKPFTPPFPNAAVLSCLLHRSFFPLAVDEEMFRQQQQQQKQQQRKRQHEFDPTTATATTTGVIYIDIDEHGNGEEDDEDSALVKRYDPSHILFRRLLRLLFSDSDDNNETEIYYERPSSFPRTSTTITTTTTAVVERCYLYPHQIRRSQKLLDIIRREFRIPSSPTEENSWLSGTFSIKTRRETAFLALRKLNEKLAWADQLQQQSASTTTLLQDKKKSLQAAKHIQPIWEALQEQKCGRGPSYDEYLKPGTFLVAHPHLSGYFRQTVICILQHGNSTDDGDDGDSFGTYGVIVNRASLVNNNNNNNRNHRTLADAVTFLPNDIVCSLGNVPIKDGGPVHLPSIQMLHGTVTSSSSTSNTANDDEIGGIPLPTMKKDDDEKIVSFRGDIIKAAQCVSAKTLDRDDVALFVGASCWRRGQLEREIRQGCWLVCRGPPEMALSGACEHDYDDTTTSDELSRPKSDLWLSIMSACGEDEAKLAHLLWNHHHDDNDNIEFSAACDDF